jgi:hypothetical protein
MTLRQGLPLILVCLALTLTAASAYAQQDQTACMSDAFTVCGQFIPNREGGRLPDLQPQQHLSLMSHRANAI